MEKNRKEELQDESVKSIIQTHLHRERGIHTHIYMRA